MVNPLGGISRRLYSTIATSGPTGIVLLNLGGPAHQDEVEPFLTRLFSDPTIVPLPFQPTTGPLLAKLRLARVKQQYQSIGGGSPIRMWTEKQGEKLIQKLDDLCPHTAPHHYYIGFRYVYPMIGDALKSMKKDGVKRAVAFSQYPQYSCSTTGSSLINLWQTLKEMGLNEQFKWSVIDRWYSNPIYVEAVAKKIKEGLAQFPTEDQHKVIIVFSAHSLPIRVVNRGDPYPVEIAATLTQVMQSLNRSNPYTLTYQSRVGPVPWLSPSTEHAVRNYASRGVDNVLIVPISFTSDHIETLREIDIDLQHTAKKLGMKMLKRAPSLNDEPLFITAMADIVTKHLLSHNVASHSFFQKCHGCNVTAQSLCRTVVNPCHPLPN